ncbi:MAG: hypothetical protein ABSD76_11530 [Terriglobales bacterium]|jgi:hypothetical protein
MHDWKERHKATWEQWYQTKLAEIARVIESEESRSFAGEIKTLEEHLKPISSDSRMAQLLKKLVVGRTWLFEAFDRLALGDGGRWLGLANCPAPSVLSRSPCDQRDSRK